jgi:tetratricopeptide (TPR) repeat protein
LFSYAWRVAALEVAIAREYNVSMRNIVWPLLLASAACAWEDVASIGAALEKERKWDEAARVYRAALTNCDGRCSWLLTSLGEMAFNRGEYREARLWFQRAQEAGAAGSVQLLSARGALYLVEGRLKEAERDLTAAIATDSSLAPALHNLASVEMQTGGLAEAEVHQSRALALWRDALGERHEYVRRAWISLSSIQGLRRDWKGAEHSLRNALAIAQTPDALANYAVVLDHLKRGKEARAIRRRLPAVSHQNATVDATALQHEDDRLRVVVH